ncbi:hypothetical protein CHUAL_009130 [Chamberlinius hualienensis]
MIGNDGQNNSNAFRMTIATNSANANSSSNCSGDLGVTCTTSGTSKEFHLRSTPWWNRRSQLEKWLFVLSSIFLLICVALALVLIAKLPYSSDQAGVTKSQGALGLHDKSSVCLTPGCILIAAEYLQSANLSANPCEDFYDFACGQYEANTAIPDHETSKTSFQSAEDVLNYRLKSVLENPPDDNENKVFKKVRDFYMSCMNRTEINILKEKPLKDLLSRLGGWPAVEGEAWSTKGDANFDWTKMIYKLRRIGVMHNLLVDFSVSVDSLNSSTYTIEVDEPSLGMPGRTYLLKGVNDSLVQKYLNFMVETAVLLGADRKIAEVDLLASLEFEINLANFTLPKEERRNFTKLYNKMTLRELNTNAPFINWVEYANEMLMQKVDENEIVIVVSPSYLRNLTKLLEETQKRY